MYKCDIFDSQKKKNVIAKIELPNNKNNIFLYSTFQITHTGSSASKPVWDDGRMERRLLTGLEIQGWAEGWTDVVQLMI